MEIARSAKDLPKQLPFPAVAIGNLDGVHLGHQALIASALAQARKQKGIPCVLTFSPHPQEVLLPPSAEQQRLSTDEEKWALLEGLGVKCVLALKFDSQLASLSPEAFFETYLHNGLKAKSLHVGHDFRFGHKRSGDTGSLSRLGQSNAIQVCIIPPVEAQGARISSSRIRQALRQGEVEPAAVWLGRPYRLTGRVVQGDGRGRQLGFPTANVHYPKEKVRPRHGVYQTRVVWKGQTFRSVTNFGIRPTVSHDPQSLAPTLETHLIDFSEDLYGETLSVDFVRWLREERRFDSLEALRRQIADDIKSVEIA